MTTWLMLIIFTLVQRSSIAPLARLRASIPGDVTIGGLISMYFPGPADDCSMLAQVGGTEILEAMLFSVDTINADKSFLPNITLGVKVFDSCGSEKAALNHVIKELVLGDAWESRAGSCENHSHSVTGVIGPFYSFEAAKITPFLNIFEIPLISGSATSAELSDKSKYEYFLRTVASDKSQVLAIVDLLLHFNWTYVSVLYSDESYGVYGYDEIEKEAEKKGIFIANKKKKVPVKYDQNKYREIVEDVLLDSMANVIVLFSIEPVLVPLLKVLQKKAGDRALELIGPETLGEVVNREQEELKKIANRIIFYYPPTAQNSAFSEYFFNLSPNSNTRNPWFRDFFQETMNCSFRNSTGGKATYKVVCNPNQTLRDANYSIFLGEFRYMPVVMDAVYGFAHAFQRILRHRCPDNNNKSCINLNEIPGKELLDTLHSEVFSSPSGNVVNFTSTGDVEGAFDVYYFGEMNNRKNTKIGRWDGHELTFYHKQWKSHFIPMISSCITKCTADQIRIKDREKPKRCWECQTCPEDAFSANETYCHKCSRGHLPDRSRRTCLRITPKHFSVNGTGSFSNAAFFLLLFSGLGISAICLVTVVSVKFRNTPLVKASGRELSCLLLIGLFLSFSYCFFGISKPSALNCFLWFVLDSLPLTISYVAIAVKNNRTYRIFNPDRKLTVRPTLIRPEAQIMVSLGLVSFQVLLLTTLTIFDIPRDEFIYPSLTEVHHICHTNDTQLILSQVYNTILLIACTYYGFKTRKIPRNFNEAKYIAFAMYGSCVTSLAFAVMTLMIPRESGAFDRVAVRSFRSILIATLLLVCFFGPKVYIVIWKGDQNTKHAFTKSTPGSERERSVADTFRCPMEPSNHSVASDVNVKKQENN